MTITDLVDQAAALDAADSLAHFRDQFIGSDDPKIIAYLDGNSLGRPLRATRDRIRNFVDQVWGSRLIRAWDEGWMDDPVRIGDDLGRVALGAASGQTVVGDSTSVTLKPLPIRPRCLAAMTPAVSHPAVPPPTMTMFLTG